MRNVSNVHQTKGNFLLKRSYEVIFEIACLLQKKSGDATATPLSWIGVPNIIYRCKFYWQDLFITNPLKYMSHNDHDPSAQYPQ